jgi:lipopolysaccharide export system permease protein
VGDTSSNRATIHRGQGRSRVFTTYDRHLFRRYLSTFLILFISTYGLYVVFDGFTNVDGFQDKASSVGAVLSRMVQYYTYRASDFFEMVGSLLSVGSAVIVLGLLYYQRELHPVLAAGIPTYRLSLPLLAGAALVNGLLIVNAEVIAPRASLELQSSRSGGTSMGKLIQPAQDYELYLNIDGEYMLAATRTLHNGRFILQAPVLVEELTTLTCDLATYYDESAKHPGGWRLQNVEPSFSALKLTEFGTRKIFRLKGSDDIFLASDVTFHQMYSQGGNYLYDSTPQLIRRINSPALSRFSIDRQILHLHTRLTRPLINLIAVMLAIPFVLRRESRSLITNMALSAGVLVLLLAGQQLCSYLAAAKMITPDFAVWIPILVGGAAAGWYSSDVLT